MDDIDLDLLHAIIMDRMKNDIPGLMTLIDPKKVGGKDGLRKTEAALKSFMRLKPKESSHE